MDEDKGKRAGGSVLREGRLKSEESLAIRRRAGDQERGTVSKRLQKGSRQKRDGKIRYRGKVGRRYWSRQSHESSDDIVMLFREKLRPVRPVRSTRLEFRELLRELREVAGGVRTPDRCCVGGGAPAWLGKPEASKSAGTSFQPPLEPPPLVEAGSVRPRISRKGSRWKSTD